MTDHLVDVRDASLRYGSVDALEAVSLELHSGAVTALLGPNGAGKTSLVKLICGLARPSTGTVRVAGGDPRLPATRTRIGFMPQHAELPDVLNVREHVEAYGTYYASPLAPEETVALAGLEGLERRRAGRLSGGQKRRLAFALAISGNPELLLLDEPTTGLDLMSRRALWETIRNWRARGRAVLLTTHYLEEADALADRIVLLRRGQVIGDDTPASIKRAVAGSRLAARTGLERADLERLPCVRSCRREGDYTVLISERAEATLRAWLAQDQALTDLSVSSASLGEAFEQLTDDPIESKEQAA